jgi:redox-sensitive bicupin YhaK (pirin superfamily)
VRVRTVERRVASIPASDGAGVKLRRSLGASPLARHDPFLMLDEFFSDNPGDYLAGFPAHPHRGFETLTYMLDGHMRHEDNHGNTGDLAPGDVQWMSAARGIVHSEMPQQTEGRMRGFQLWINLPAREKMRPAAYRDIRAREIPVAREPDGCRVKVIAGALGDVSGPLRGGSTDLHFFDVGLPPGRVAKLPVPARYNAFVYVYEGETAVGEAESVPQRTAALLCDGDTVALTAGPQGACALVLAARPIGEPVVQYGPFVMNTREEIEQAVRDYDSGAF